MSNGTHVQVHRQGHTFLYQSVPSLCQASYNIRCQGVRPTHVCIHLSC